MVSCLRVVSPTPIVVMSISLENAALRLELNPAKAAWSLLSRQKNGPVIRGAQCLAIYRRGSRRQAGMGSWEPGETHGPEIVPSPHGPLEQITLEFEPDRSPLRYALTFALAQDHPLLLWRLKIHNTSPHPVRLGRLELLRVGLPGIAQRTTTYSPGSIQGRFRGLIRPHAKGGELGFFSNGWQSWN